MRGFSHRGISRILGYSILLSGVVLPSATGSLVAQTAEERVRAEYLRQHAELLRQREEMLQQHERQRMHQEQEIRRHLEQRRQEMEEIRRHARDQARRARQVVVRAKSRIRLGVTLTGTQGGELDGRGVEIQDVMEGSPAEGAGLQEGDIITHLNGHPLTEPIPGEDEEEFDEDRSLPVQRLMSLAGELDEGDPVEIRYLRDGDPGTASFAAAEMEDRALVMYMRGREMDELQDLRIELKELERLEGLGGLLRGYATRGREGPALYSVLGAGSPLGLDLTEINPGLSEYFETDTGLLVLKVDEDSALEVRAGDVILEIDGREIEDQGDLMRIIRSYEADEAFSMTLMRKGREVVVEGRVG